MWQVSGRSNITDFEEVVKLDKQYISEWTMGLDIDDVEMVLMGTSMKPERFKDEVLAKMKYDAVKKN